MKKWLIIKDPDAEKDLKQEKGTTESETDGWHHRLKGHEFEQALGVGDGQGSLECCSPCGLKESDPTERLNCHWYWSYSSLSGSPKKRRLFQNKKQCVFCLEELILIQKMTSKFLSQLYQHVLKGIKIIQQEKIPLDLQLAAERKQAVTQLHKMGQSGHPCLVPDLRGNAFSFSPLSMMLTLSLSYMAFIMLRYVPYREKEMATHSSILAWRILWTEEPGGLLSIGLHRVVYDWSNLACIGERNGNPLQCSCLENPRGRGAWWAVSMRSHRVGHDWSDLAAAAACSLHVYFLEHFYKNGKRIWK